MNMIKLLLKGAVKGATSVRQAETAKAEQAAAARQEEARQKRPAGLFALVKSLGFTGKEQEVLFVALTEAYGRPLIGVAPVTGPDAGRSLSVWATGRTWAEVLANGVETAQQRGTRDGHRHDIIRGSSRGDSVQACLEEFADVVAGRRKATPIEVWAEAAAAGALIPGMTEEAMVEAIASATAAAVPVEYEEVLQHGGPTLFRARERADGTLHEESFAGFLPESVQERHKRILEGMARPRQEPLVRKGEWKRRSAKAPQAPLSGPMLMEDEAARLRELVTHGGEEAPAAAPLSAAAADYDAYMASKRKHG